MSNEKYFSDASLMTVPKLRSSMYNRPAQPAANGQRVARHSVMLTAETFQMTKRRSALSVAKPR